MSFDLYGPVHNAFDAGNIHYKGKRGLGPGIETFLGPVK